MKKILIVDDEPDIRNTLKSILEKLDYTVQVAVDGTDCLSKNNTFHPDLILLDIMMPGEPVSSILNQITQPKIIFLTAKQTTETEKNRYLSKNNVKDFIHKPFNMEDLITRIKKALAATHMEDSSGT